MSRPASAMNSSNSSRKFVILAVVLGLLGAILVYVAFSRTSSPASLSGGVAAVVATQDIPARTKITESMVEVRLLPTNARSVLASDDVKTVVGKITRFPVAANEQVLSNKIIDLSAAASAGPRSLSFVVPQSMRAIAINTRQVANAGGLILPGDHVDVLVVYSPEFVTSPTDFTQRTRLDHYVTTTLLQNKEVLAVSQVIVDVVPEASPSSSPDRARNTEAKPIPDASTITLALTPEDSQKIFLAEANGDIRLVARAYGDTEERPLSPMIAPELFRNLPNPFLQR